MHALFMKHNKLAAAQSTGKRGPCGRGNGMPWGRNRQDIFCIDFTDRRKAIISHNFVGRARDIVTFKSSDKYGGIHYLGASQLGKHIESFRKGP